jgi:hypothetical protein
VPGRSALSWKAQFVNCSRDRVPIRRPFDQLSSQSAVEHSVPTFRCRGCIKACRLRTLCFRNVCFGALPEKRVRSSSWLHSFPDSRSVQSRHKGIGQYRSGVVFGKFSSPIKRSGERSGYWKTDSPHPSLTSGRRADRLWDKSKSHAERAQRVCPKAPLRPMNSTVNRLTLAISCRTQTHLVMPKCLSGNEYRGMCR